MVHSNLITQNNILFTTYLHGFVSFPSANDRDSGKYQLALLVITFSFFTRAIDRDLLNLVFRHNGVLN
jgi:hypothetical protein